MGSYSGEDTIVSGEQAGVVAGLPRVTQADQLRVTPVYPFRRARTVASVSRYSVLTLYEYTKAGI